MTNRWLAQAVLELLESRRMLSSTTITWGDVNQEIVGIGASSAWTTQSLTNSQAQLLYSTTDGAGLSSLRSRINEDATTKAPSEPAAAGTYETRTMDYVAELNAPVLNQVQTIQLIGTGLSGSYTLTYGGQTTSAIAYNASAATITADLKALSTIGSSGAVVNAAGNEYSIVFNTTVIASPSLVTINSSGLSVTSGSVIAGVYAAGGVQQWSTPWSPPAAWKTNGSVDNGGYLDTGTDPTTGVNYYQEYANYLATYVQTMDNQSNQVNGSWPKISLAGISLQNEPDENVSYDSCLWTAQEFANFLPYAYAAFNNLKTSNLIPAGDPVPEIIMPEESGWHDELAATVLNTPALNADVSVYALHDYDNGSGVLAGTSGKQVWMTEVYDGNSATGISAGLWEAQNIYNMFVTSDANEYDYWWIQDGSASGNGQLLGPNWGQTPLFWAEANYAKFVRPGWNNIAQTNSGGITSSAYANTSNGQFATVLVNSGTSPITETINLSGAYAPVLTPYLTNATAGLVQQTPIPATGSGYIFTYTIPAQSIVTLTGTASTSPITNIPAGITATPNGTTGMSLAWTNNISGATGYTLQRSINGTSWTTLSSSLSSSTYSYSDTGLSNNTLYYYRVYPNNNATDYSNVSYATTAANPVTNLTSSYSTGTLNVTLNWTASTTSGVDYQVLRSSNGGSTWTTLTSGISNGTNTYTDTTAPEAASLQYEVIAIDGMNTSAAATVSATTTVVRAPTSLTAAAGSAAGSVLLNWTTNSNEPVTTYIERSSNGGSSWTIIGTVASGITTYTDANPGPGTFEYQVQSFYNGIYSAFSNTASFTVSVLYLTGASGNNTFYFKDSGSTLDVWINSATPGSGTPTQTAALSSFTSISLTGGSGNNSVTLDYSGGDPTNGSFTYSGSGAGTDTLTINGETGGKTATLGASSVIIGSDTINYSNLEYLDLDLGAGSSTLTASAPGTSPLLTLTIDSGATTTLGTSSTFAANTIVADAGTLNLSGENESIDQITGQGTVTSSGNTLTIGSNNGTSTFAGVISGNLSVDKTGTGTFTNTGTSSYTGQTTVDTGTLSFAPTSGSASIGSTSTSVLVAPANTDNGTLDIGPNVNLTCGGAYGGLFVGCNGVNVNGGGIGVLNQTGGTITVTNDCDFGGANTVNNGASGTWNFSAGAANISTALKLAINQDSIAALNISGSAQLNMLSNNNIDLGLYYGRVATVNQTGGNVTFYSNAGTTVGGTGSVDITGGTAEIYNLDGGELSVPSISWTAPSGGSGGGSIDFNFAGGTLQTSAASSAFFPVGYTTITDGTGGATIDTKGNAVTFGVPFAHLSSLGSAPDGGLTVEGAGTLTLSPSSSYTGPTTDTGGATLDVTGTIASSDAINVTAGSSVSTLILATASAVSSAAPIVASTTGAALPVISASASQTLGTISSVGTINLNAGTFTTAGISDPSAGQTSTLNVAAGINLSSAFIRQGILNLGTGAKVTILSNSAGPGQSGTLSTLTDLENNGSKTSLTSATLDLRNNALIVRDPAEHAAVVGAVVNAEDFNTGTGLNQWDKPGITSSSAQTNASAYALGYATGAELGRTSFEGQTIATGSTAIMYTLLGDTVLRGTVDGNDYNTVLGNFDIAGDWSAGNFFNESIVGGDDYNAVLNNFDLAATGGVQPAGSVSSSPAPAATSTTPASATTPLNASTPTAATTTQYDVVVHPAKPARPVKKRKS
jgi:O-glycosyl hydrolase